MTVRDSSDLRLRQVPCRYCGAGVGQPCHEPGALPEDMHHDARRITWNRTYVPMRLPSGAVVHSPEPDTCARRFGAVRVE